MGLKDLFKSSKTKEKEAFHEEIKEVAKGKIVPGKADELAAMAEAAGQNPADDKTMMRKSIYNKAAGSAKARGKLTAEESAELSKIQKFLALEDDQVEKTKFDLARLRTVTDIRAGKLPVVPPTHPLLRGMQFLPREVAHYVVPVGVEDRATASGANGVLLRWESTYIINSARGHNLPAKATAKDLGEGSLLLTNKRLYLRAAKTAAVEYSPQANFFLYVDGLRIERSVGNTILRFKSSDATSSEIVGELLAVLMR